MFREESCHPPRQDGDRRFNTLLSGAYSSVDSNRLLQPELEFSGVAHSDITHSRPDVMPVASYVQRAKSFQEGMGQGHVSAASWWHHHICSSTYQLTLVSGWQPGGNCPPVPSRGMRVLATLMGF